MATVREGNNPALLIVDVQVAAMQYAWDATRIIQNISRAVEKAREQGVPVIWVQHADDDLVHSSPGWQLAPELEPRSDETRLDKSFNSSFERTMLEETLARLGVSRIVLAGAATNWCIRATAYAALDKGYDLTLLKDAHTTEDIELDNGDTIEARDIIRDLNIAMAWLSYPGRTNRAVSVEDLEF